MTTPETFFTTRTEGHFGTFTSADDLLHPEANARVDHYSCTETQYLGFNVPERDISSVNYFWHHPRLHTVLGGSICYRGVKRQVTAAELCDIRSYMSDSVFENDLHSFAFDSGYRVQVLEPGRRLRIQYDDPGRQNFFDVTLTAVMPPAMWPTGRHFEQAMKTSGQLVLRGDTIDVDGYFVRDRSWGEGRSEAAAAVPATGWMTGVFSDDFAFSCNAVDDPALDPIWRDHFTVDRDKLLFGGWVWRDGRLASVVSASKVTRYDLDTLVPTSVDVRMVDSEERVFEVHGDTRNSVPFNAWMNVHAPLCLTRWECDGAVGYGDLQEVQWTDFVQTFMTGGRSR